MNYHEKENIAREYYNSHDADTFYSTVWGGEDLHLGIYTELNESIFDASRRTVQEMAFCIRGLGKDTKVLDMGSGFGGTARYLAKTYGCSVVALNLSEKENERNRKMNTDQGLDHLIEVIDGTFERLHFSDESFDVVWSQDAFLHSENREHILKEAYRVLKDSGELIFTDPMRADDCPRHVLQPILERIHLSSLGSPGYYIFTGNKVGFRLISHRDLTEHLTQHYDRVLQETLEREGQLKRVISVDYIERMKKGLKLWTQGGKNKHLAWGIFHFSKVTN